eukprot:TRINITY_DN33892_c0_g1_i1.p1 TRINITY_DN33892_c0_g1~~TRINITY_DN33892_c0_g1_i1.p1  ORF type:complete len:135 (+),score=5.14 TRINITY_DN33892_c0_g1_i1:45-407(+)
MLFGLLAGAASKQVVSPGDGKHFPQKGDTVTMKYTGTLDNGKRFDHSSDFSTKIGVGRVIKCWDSQVPLMSKGEKANLICRPSVAYGSKSPTKKIPPNSTLHFAVTLKKIHHPHGPMALL